MPAVLLLAGAVALIAGVALMSLAAGLATAGALMLLAGIDLRR
jgi:hypothetical protein